MARRMYKDDGSWVDYAPEGEVVNRSGNWGTAGYDPDGRPVNLDGQDYYQVGMPWGTGERFDGQTYQGRPYSEFTREDPRYGTLARGDALKDAGRLNPSSFFDYLPGLLMALAGPAGLAGAHAAAVGAPSLLSSLGSATGLGSPLNIPHGPAFGPGNGLEPFGYGGAGGSEGAGWEPTEGGAGPDTPPGDSSNGAIFAPSLGGGGPVGPTASLEQMMAATGAGQPLLTGGLGTSAQQVSLGSSLGIPASALGAMGVTGLAALAPQFLGSQGGAAPTSMGNQLAPQQSGGSVWDQIFNPKGSTTGAVGSLLELLGKRSQANDWEDFMRQSQERFDPFSSERDKYKQLLSRSYLDPTYFDNDSTLANLDKRTTRETERYLSSKGFSNSGNLGLGIADNLSEGRAKYALSHQNQLAQLAGAGISPASAAQNYAQGAQLGSNANQGMYAAGGNLLKNLPGLIGDFKGVFG